MNQDQVMLETEAESALLKKVQEVVGEEMNGNSGVHIVQNIFPQGGAWRGIHAHTREKNHTLVTSVTEISTNNQIIRDTLDDTLAVEIKDLLRNWS